MDDNWTDGMCMNDNWMDDCLGDFGLIFKVKA